MVAPKQNFKLRANGTIDVDIWLDEISNQYCLTNINLIKTACTLVENAALGLTTFYGQAYLEQSLEIAKIILDLQLDQEAVAASIIANSISLPHLKPEIITEKLGENVKKLAFGVSEINIINNLANKKSRDQKQIDRLRKAFLSLASDIRVVLIKLAERIVIMRGIKNINLVERKRFAEETLNLYAPLANRLGLGQLKWELEDIAFHYFNPEIYKDIAKYLAERRTDREKRITSIVNKINQELVKANINAELSGRAKHIYSIYLKMKQKDLELKDIYDYSAVRILVPKINDCYTALSIVHNIWEHIPEEFDDYISNPKANGYKSIHTAVKEDENKSMEIQIRTNDMHNEAEHGIAAHWMYKEKNTNQNGYKEKITFLRQLLAWHKDVAKDEAIREKNFLGTNLDDRLYVFTPRGDILDLPIGATPLDFAYQIHSELGHKCRGAKINKHIVPLTYTLQTGDQVEIITIKNGAPSRDWLNKGSGYITTSRSRAKILQWFRQQEIEEYAEIGKINLERELNRLNITNINYMKLAGRLNFKNELALFAAIGHGTLRVNQVVQTAQSNTDAPIDSILPILKKTFNKNPQKNIFGTNDLLSRIALCCKPIPGENIIGYITQGRGISIHNKNCRNIANLILRSEEKFMEIFWDEHKQGSYFVDLKIRAIGQEDLLRRISAAIANLNIQLLNLNSTYNKKTNMTFITMSIQLYNLVELQLIQNHLKQVNGVIEVKRTQE